MQADGAAMVQCAKDLKGFEKNLNKRLFIEIFCLFRKSL